MRKTLVIMAACLLMVAYGCASMGLPDNATPEQIKAARCQDAQIAKALADANLAIIYPAGPETATAKAYWQAYLMGANLGVSLACGN